MATLNAHGMEPQEEAIMDAWDEGKSPDAIARELGLTRARVDVVVNNFSDKASDRWHLHVPAASARLLAALQGMAA